MNDSPRFARMAALVFTLIGCVGLLIMVVTAIAHFGFGMPVGDVVVRGQVVHEDHLAGTLIEYGALFAGFAVIGFWWMNTTK